jgi:hypothetical protein
MDSGIVTVFASLATISVTFAIVLGLGKKYHDEDQRNSNSLTKYQRRS